MSSNERTVSCRMFKSRTVDRMAFSEDGLTAGVKLQNSSLFLELLTTRSELVSKEVKRDVWIPPFALSIPTIDDLSFGGMHLQAALFQAGLKIGLNGFSFLLGPAVHQPVVSVSTPWEARVHPFHPEIKRVMQEQIG